MFRRFMRKIHRWVFITMGVFMLLWVVSGIMISVPNHRLERKAVGLNHAVDYAAFTQSPATIVSKISQMLGTDAAVKSLGFQKIGDRDLYSVQVNNGDNLLLDAHTGEPFSITAEMAEDLVRKGFKVDTTMLENTTLRKHTISYAYGPLPVYRLRFKSDSSAVYYVNPMTGNVHESTFLTRARMAAGFLHSFQPIKVVTGRESLQVGSLLVVGTVSLIGVLAGVYLIFPLGRRR